MSMFVFVSLLLCSSLIFLLFQAFFYSSALVRSLPSPFTPQVSSDTQTDGGKPSSVHFSIAPPVRNKLRVKEERRIKAVWCLKSHFLSNAPVPCCWESWTQRTNAAGFKHTWRSSEWAPSLLWRHSSLPPSLCLSMVLCLSPPAHEGFKKDMNYLWVYVLLCVRVSGIEDGRSSCTTLW